MNYKILGKILGKIMILEGALMLAPLVISLIYKEPFLNTLAFIVPVLLLFGTGFLLQLLKPEIKKVLANIHIGIDMFYTQLVHIF